MGSMNLTRDRRSAAIRFVLLTAALLHSTAAAALSAHAHPPATDAEPEAASPAGDEHAPRTVDELCAVCHAFGSAQVGAAPSHGATSHAAGSPVAAHRTDPLTVAEPFPSIHPRAPPRV